MVELESDPKMPKLPFASRLADSEAMPGIWKRETVCGAGAMARSIFQQAVSGSQDPVDLKAGALSMT